MSEEMHGETHHENVHGEGEEEHEGKLLFIL